MRQWLSAGVHDVAKQRERWDTLRLRPDSLRRTHNALYTAASVSGRRLASWRQDLPYPSRVATAMLGREPRLRGASVQLRVQRTFNASGGGEFLAPEAGGGHLARGLGHFAVAACSISGEYDDV